MDQVTLFDVAVTLFILFLGLKGIFRGFIKEAFSLVGIIGGIFIASRYGDSVGEWIDKNLYHFQNQAALSLIGFLIVLVSVWLIAIFLGALFSSLVKSEKMGVVDRTFGFIVGVLKVFFIVSIIVYIISTIDILKSNLEKYSKNSILYPYLIKTGSYILKLKAPESEESIEQKEAVGEENIAKEDASKKETEQKEMKAEEKNATTEVSKENNNSNN